MKRWMALPLLAVAMLLAVGCSPMHLTLGASPADRELQRTTVHREPGVSNPRIAIIDVTGIIVNAERPALLDQGENPVSLLHEMLEKAADDARVHAVILRLNTPGGTVTASDAMYREVQRFRERTGKPVIALMMDVAASGGYYVACAADVIVAYPTSITGSVGVIAQTVSFESALNQWGVRTETFRSGDNKAAGSPLINMTDSHREILQGLVDDFFESFEAIVRSARPDMTDEDFQLVTDGRVVSGNQAARIGLIDQTGDLYQAIDIAKREAGLETANVVRYHRPGTYVGSPYAMARDAGPGRQVPNHAGHNATQFNLLQLNIDSLPGTPAGAGIYYLWRPELH